MVTLGSKGSKATKIQKEGQEAESPGISQELPSLEHRLGSYSVLRKGVAGGPSGHGEDALAIAIGTTPPERDAVGASLNA